jgi:type I restriction enzyme R subunit
MVFFTGKIVLALDNPTILVITDRNDLDDQLFDTFAASTQLLRQEPRQVESRDQLKELLQVASGGVIFSTIQKFQPDEGNVFDTLSERKNIVVIADEAHRTQYGFKAKTIDCVHLALAFWVSVKSSCASSSSSFSTSCLPSGGRRRGNGAYLL